MSYSSPHDVDPSSPTQPQSGKPIKPEDFNVVIRRLEKRVKDLEDTVAQITRQGGGLSLTSPDGVITKTLSIDNTGTPIWT